MRRCYLLLPLPLRIRHLLHLHLLLLLLLTAAARRDDRDCRAAPCEQAASFQQGGRAGAACLEERRCL